MSRGAFHLKTRLLLLVSSMLLVTGALSGWITARLESDRLIASMRASTAVLTANVATDCARYLVLEDYAELEAYLLKTAELPDIRTIQVSGPDGMLLGEIVHEQGRPPRANQVVDRITPPRLRAATVTVTDGLMIVWQPVEAGDLLGWVRVAYDLSAIHEAQHATWVHSLLLSLVWVILSAVLILIALRPMVRAIGALSSFARRLDEHKGEQIAVEHRSIEMEELCESLNYASRRLYAAEQQLINEQRLLHESETMYRSLFMATAGGVVFQAAGGKITAVNPAAERIVGRTAAQMLEQLPEDRPWSAIHEDGSPFPAEEQPAMVTLRTGKPQYDVIVGIHRPDGSLVWVSINSQPLVADGETAPYAVVTTFHDITELKRAEQAMRGLNRELRAISNCNQLLLRAVDEKTLLDNICRIVCDEAGYRMAWVGFTENDEQRATRPVAWAGGEEGYLALAGLTWSDTERGRGPSGIAIRTGTSSAIQDFTIDPLAEPWRDSALERGFRSCIALPLKDESGASFGVLCIYSAFPDAFTPDEVRLLEELAGNLAFGISVLRARTERLQAITELRQSEAKFSAAFHASPDLMAVTRVADGKILEVNEAYTRLLGYTRDESLGRTTSELSIWGDQADRQRFIVRLATTGQVDEFEVRLRRRDGTVITCIDSARTVVFGGERCILSVVHDISERKRA